MSRTKKRLVFLSLAVMVVLCAVSAEASIPMRSAGDLWAALWQPLASLFTGAPPQAGSVSPLRSTAAAGGAAADPNGFTEQEEGGGEGTGSVSTSGPTGTTEGGGAIDPNGLSERTEEGPAIDPNG